jgi:rhodanese-related sulfurtransferase
VALHARLTLHDLAEIDLSYAPPYSSANDPINMAAFVGENDLSGYSPLITAPELKVMLEAGASDQGPLVPDVRNINEFATSHLKGAMNIAVDELRFRLDEVPRDRPIVVHCKSGFRSHLALRILKENGWTDVKNLTGGYVIVKALGGFDTEES